MEQKNNEFITKPNLTKKLDIIKMECCFGINDIFDIYYSKNDNNELYLIYPGDDFKIIIMRLKDKKKIKELIGHKEKSIRMIRHFYNPNVQKDYLISTNSNIVKVWDLSNNYNLLYSLEIKYSENTLIYSCLLYFSNNVNYLITSSNENYQQDYTKLFNFSDGKFISDLEKTNTKEIYYLLLWNKNENDYLIQCSNSQILIHNIENKKLFKILKDESNSSNHNSACLSKKGEIDYLYVSTVRGLINIWNLNNFELKGSIKYFNHYFYHIINWSNMYLLIADKSNNSILIIDTTNDIVISVLSNIHESFVIGLKKIYHPLYGESLLSSDIEGKIILSTKP